MSYTMHCDPFSCLLCHEAVSDAFLWNTINQLPYSDNDVRGSIIRLWRMIYNRMNVKGKRVSAYLCARVCVCLAVTEDFSCISWPYQTLFHGLACISACRLGPQTRLLDFA